MSPPVRGGPHRWRPGNDTKELSYLLRVPRNAEGFFLEAHMKLRPVDFASEGIFLCGTAHSPKFISETISQAKAVAPGPGRSCRTADVSGLISYVDPDRCAACLTCVASVPTACPRSALKTAGDQRGPVPGLRHLRVGVPRQGDRAAHYVDDQLSAKVKTES